jgi:hypothetical protein
MPDPQQASPNVLISVLNWNGWQSTLGCLESVRRLDYPNYLTVVVDNGSTNDSVERIRAWARQALPCQDAFVEYTREQAMEGGDAASEARLSASESPNRLVLVRNEENLGFTGGNNVAIQYALRRNPPADFVLLLNNDVTVESGCLRELVRAGSNAHAAIVGATLLGAKESGASDRRPVSYVRWLFDPLVSPRVPRWEENDQVVKVNVVIGAAMLIAREALESLRLSEGVFLDDKLFFGWDEAEFCHRAAKAGYNIVIAKRAVARDIGRKTVAGGWSSPLYVYYRERNKILVAAKVLPPGLKLLFHFTNPPLALGRAFKDLCRRRPRSARAVLLGLLDGYRGVGGKWKWHDREAFSSRGGEA